MRAPGFRGGEREGVTHFAGTRHESEANATACGVPGGPAFARSCVGCVAIGAEALSVDPGERDGGDGLVAIETEQLADDCCCSNLDEQHVIEAEPC